MLWSTLLRISDQATLYSTALGNLWYTLVFIFRLIIVATIGSAAYGDEQSSFQCSTKTVGCAIMCYNEFAKISHMRFWSFQLLAVLTPSVFFHCYCTYETTAIERLKDLKNKRIKRMEEGADTNPDVTQNDAIEKERRALTKRSRSVGRVKVNQVYSENELKEVSYTNNIKRAYFINVVLRLVIEGCFICLGYFLFNNPSSECAFSEDSCQTTSNFLWMHVPGFYKCVGERNSGVHRACSQHFGYRLEFNHGYVPCFVSRPYEKTVFLRYMTILSAICFLLAGLDLLYLLCKKIRKVQASKPKETLRNFHPMQIEGNMLSVYPCGTNPYPCGSNYSPSKETNCSYIAVPVNVKPEPKEPVIAREICKGDCWNKDDQPHDSPANAYV